MDLSHHVWSWSTLFATHTAVLWHIKRFYFSSVFDKYFRALISKGWGVITKQKILRRGDKSLSKQVAFHVHNMKYFLRSFAGLGVSVGYTVRLETRRLRVQPPSRSATFFRGDWSWNIFYGHSFPSADSRRAVVSFWRKNVHNTG